MQDSFAWLEKQFYHVKDTKDPQQYEALIKQTENFINKYHDRTEVEEQIITSQVLEYLLKLYLLTDKKEQAEQIEERLNKEFYGIHKIGKLIDTNSNAPTSNGKLNLSADLLDMARLKQFSVKQKGTTKPKLLGWALKIIGLALIGLAAWLFTQKWIWTPLIIGIIGVFLSTIGSQVTHVVNRFLNTMAFNSGNIIPGIITHVNKNNYQVIFMAPLMKNKDQIPHWGLKKLNLKKEIGRFQEGDKLAGVCIYPQELTDYYQDFIPTPVCLGYKNEVIPYKAKQIIKEQDWQNLQQAVKCHKQTIDSFIVLDNNFQIIN